MRKSIRYNWWGGGNDGARKRVFTKYLLFQEAFCSLYKVKPRNNTTAGRGPIVHMRKLIIRHLSTFSRATK